MTRKFGDKCEKFGDEFGDEFGDKHKKFGANPCPDKENPSISAAEMWGKKG